jgi:hypothetical protein
MGVLIVAGTVTLVVLIVQRSSGLGTMAVPPITLDLPADARIVSVAGAGDRFAVLVDGPGGTRMLLLDARTVLPEQDAQLADLVFAAMRHAATSE